MQAIDANVTGSSRAPRWRASLQPLRLSHLNWRRWGGYLWAFGLGLLFMLTIFPPDLLLTGAVPDARLSGDVAQHVVGQRAFLADSWHWPLLRTTLLDWPGGLNIAMTDGNPLVALPLKLFRGVLPAGFSAVQLWMALAYVLQPVAAVFALRSAGETRFIPAVAVSLFAISMPTFLFRHTHSALSSHFMLLTALGTYCRMVRGLRGDRLLPLLLLPASLLVHPYMAVMTFGLLAAAPVTLACRLNRRCWPATLSVAAALLLMVLTALIFGYQAATPSGGFGESSMNLLSPVFPTYSYFIGRGLPFMDATGSQYEGYQYLGLGMLGMLALCLVTACLSERTGFLRRHAGIYLACLVLTGLALSNIVYAGTHRILDLGPAPDVFQQIRASGRLFWPVAYVLMVGGVATLARLLPISAATVVLLGLALLQVGDATQLRGFVHRDLRTTMVMPIEPTRLDTLLGASDRLTILPTFGCGANAAWPEFDQLLLASTRLRVPANTMYVARFQRLQDCANTATAETPLAPGELRVFLANEAQAGPATMPDGAALCRMLSTVAVCTRRGDLLQGLLPTTVTTVAVGQTIGTGSAGQVGILGPGWYMPEPVAVWTVDHAAIIALRAEFPAGDIAFAANITGFIGVTNRPQTVSFLVNGHHVTDWQFSVQKPMTLRAVIPHADLLPGTQILRFEIAHPTRPSDLHVNRDTRQLGIFLQSIRLDPVQPPG